jgi:hypothetical protein
MQIITNSRRNVNPTLIQFLNILPVTVIPSVTRQEKKFKFRGEIILGVPYAINTCRSPPEKKKELAVTWTNLICNVFSL